MKKFLSYFSPYLKEYKLQWVFAFIGVLFTLIGTLGLAEIMKHLIDDALIPKNEHMLYVVSFSVVVLYSVKGVGRYVQAYFVNLIGQDIIRRLRDKVLDHMLHLDMNFFHTSKSGELISRLSNDIARIQNIVATLIPELVRDSLTVIGLITYAVVLNYELAFYALVILPITFYPLLLLAKKMKHISHASQEKNADVTVRLTEIFNNVEMIQANSTENEEVARFAKHNQDFFKINMKGVKVSEFINPMMEVFGALGIAAMLIVGGLYVINGAMTQGELIAFVTAIGMIADPSKKIANLLNRMQDGVAAAERVYSILDKEKEIKNGAIKTLPEIKNISFKSVSLFYDDIKALHDINFSVHKGENIALIGDSGGGKSSLVNLILRFYDVNSGEVLFNDKNIQNYDLKSLRSHIAMVSQRVYIFADTLAQNVAYGCEYDEQKIIDALAKADATHFVDQLKQGIHTVMEEFGSNLSGGQRQRIAIARAIYKDADILILDEATSALDNKSEVRIQAALEDICKDKITFTIAHRLSTIESADKILVFKKGEIVDQGTHAYLLEHSTEYQRLRGEV